MMLKYAVGFLLVCGMAKYTSALTEEDISNVKEIIREQLFVPDPMNIPRAVRLAFHDCVGRNKCDGCLDFTLADNQGLQGIYNSIVQLYTSNQIQASLKTPSPGGLSRADFIALVGVAAVQQGFYNGAVQQGSRGSPAIFSPFKVGRQDIESCEGINIHPEPHFGTEQTFNFLTNEFGINRNEAVVLLGAHGLGGACPENSNHHGQWTSQPFSLDNEYYEEVREPWNAVRNEQGVVDWRRGGRNNANLFMFNVDMATERIIPVVNDPTRVVRQRTREFPLSSTAPKVRELARSNNAFTTQFPLVFTKMIENSNVQLTAVDSEPNFTDGGIFNTTIVGDSSRICVQGNGGNNGQGQGNGGQGMGNGGRGQVGGGRGQGGRGQGGQGDNVQIQQGQQGQGRPRGGRGGQRGGRGGSRGGRGQRGGGRG